MSTKTSWQCFFTEQLFNFDSTQATIFQDGYQWKRLKGHDYVLWRSNTHTLQCSCYFRRAGNTQQSTFACAKHSKALEESFRIEASMLFQFFTLTRKHRSFVISCWCHNCSKTSQFNLGLFRSQALEIKWLKQSFLRQKSDEPLILSTERYRSDYQVDFSEKDVWEFQETYETSLLCVRFGRERTRFTFGPKFSLKQEKLCQLFHLLLSALNLL